MTSVPTAPAFTDAELVARSLAGSREAFGEIVARYQTLICSVTYSATGSLTRSQDLSQETFLTAWKRLADLREPASLRSWLCGIARNLNHRSHRSEQREPTHGAEPLEAALDLPALEIAPAEKAISREEESILWRSLERIPENYREPLILFYRQHHSVEQVAVLLDLSEDVVKQRLSRGRKLLQEEVAAALPVNLGMPASLAVAKGGGIFPALTLAIIGLAGSLFGSLGLVGLADSPKLRRFTVRLLLAMWGDCLALWIALPLSHWLRARQAWPDRTFALVQTGCYFVWAVVMAALVVRFWRGYLAHFGGPGRGLIPVPKPTGAAVGATAALIVGSLAWLVQIGWVVGDFVTVTSALVTAGAAFTWTIVLPRQLQAWGFNPVRFSGVPAALITGLILVLLNCRLDDWMAAFRGTDLAGAHRFLPMGIVHLASAVFVLWVAALVVFTRPRERH